MLNQKSAYKVWVSILDHFSAVNQSSHALQNEETDSRKVKAASHADMTPSTMKKDVLISFSTGLFSKEDEGSGEVNLECALEVGTIIQQFLDGRCFTDKISSKSQVKNLAHLRKPVKVSETSFVVYDLKLFNRLISIADRELPLLEGLAYDFFC